MKHLKTVLLAGGLLLALEALQARTPGSGPGDPRPAPHTSWNDYGGGADSSQVEGTDPTGDGGGYLFNPIVVDGVM